MNARTIEKTELINFLAGLGGEYDVFASVKKDGAICFEPLSSPEDIVFCYPKSLKTPKEFFFPQAEVLFTFQGAERQTDKPAANTKPQVLFGLRPCDSKAMLLLDSVFDQEDYQDPYYIEKRKNMVLMEELEGKNVLIVGGGFAFTTLRATIRYMLHTKNRSRYKNITVIYGARSPGELIYKSQLKQWEQRDDIDMHITVDKGDENWKGREGFVPTALKEVSPSSENAISLVCGPPIMLKFTMLPLIELGFSPEMIITSLERRMSCGIGKCGRCNIGSKYVCKDGPVFTYKQVQELPEPIF